MASEPSLQHRLDRLAVELAADAAPTSSDGGPVALVALLPCEPVVGEAVVACWVDEAGGEAFFLHRLDDGARIDDHAALREALALIAMTETLEELASFHELGACADAFDAWRAGAGDTTALDRPIEHVREALVALHALAPGDEPRVARTQRLDALGAALRQLEARWTALEGAAETWSDAQLAAYPDDSAVATVVQDLWRALAAGRRGPLARPPSEALHAGREAGTAMASAIAEAMRDMSTAREPGGGTSPSR